MRRILLTGARGFIGRHVTAALLRLGDSAITALTRREVNGALSADEIEWIAYRDVSVEGLKDAIAGRSFDAIYHLAAAGVDPRDRNPNALFEANCRFPVSLVQAVSGHSPPVFVALGSCSEYAPLLVQDQLGHKLIEETMALETCRLYGATKAAGTLAASAVARAEGVPFVCLRGFNVFGPGEAPGRLLSTLISRLSRGEAVPLSEGRQIRDFIYVGDVVSAMIRAQEWLQDESGCGGIFNLCTARGTSVADLARTVADLMGADRKLLQFGALGLRPDDVAWQVGNNAKLEAELNFSPATSLQDGLSLAIAAATRQVGT